MPDSNRAFSRQHDPTLRRVASEYAIADGARRARDLCTGDPETWRCAGADDAEIKAHALMHSKLRCPMNGGDERAEYDTWSRCSVADRNVPLAPQSAT